MAEAIGEPLAVLYGLVRDMDASTSCDQRGDSQITCADRDCPRCTAHQLAVQSLKGCSIVAVIVKDLVQKLPHLTLADDVSPAIYRSQFHGNFPFPTLDRQAFRDHHSKFREI